MLISPKKASDTYNVSQQKLKRLSDSGKVPCLKTNGGHRRYVVESLERIFNNSASVDSAEVEKLKKENKYLRDRIARLEKKLSEREIAEVKYEQAKSERERLIKEESEVIEEEFQEWRKSDLVNNFDEETKLHQVFDPRLDDYYAEVTNCIGNKAHHFLNWRKSELTDKAIYASDVLQYGNGEYIKTQMTIYSWLELYPYGWCDDLELQSSMQYRYGKSPKLLDIEYEIIGFKEEIFQLTQKRDRIKGIGKGHTADRELINRKIEEKKIKIERYIKAGQIWQDRYLRSEAYKTLSELNQTADYAFEMAARDRANERINSCVVDSEYSANIPIPTFPVFSERKR